MKNYILLPSDMRNSDEVLDLLMNEGAAGYGTYIMMLEFLRECEKNRTKNDPRRIAFNLRLSDVELIKRVLNDYHLFEFDEEEKIFCPWLEKALTNYREKTEKCRQAGVASALARRAAAENQPKTDNGCSTSVQQTLNGHSTENQQYNITNSINKTVPTNQPTNASAQMVDFGGVWAVDGVTLDNICREYTVGMTDAFRQKLLNYKDDAHNPAAVVEIAEFFKLTDRQTFALYKITGGAEIGSRNLIKLLAIFKHVKQTKLDVKYPMNYLTKKMQENG